MNSLNRILALLLLFSLITMCGCVDRFPFDETELYTGDPITPEMIDSIFDAISVEVTEKYPTETEENGDLIVYWLEGGTVWHASKECGNVLRADPDKLKSGSIADAYYAGKDRACKICSSKIEAAVSTYEITDMLDSMDSTELVEIKYPKNFDANGDLIVYWLENGSVWHESAACGTVLKSDPAKLHTGTAYQAYEAGKERACKVCSSDSIIVIIVTETSEEATVSTDSYCDQYPKDYDSDGKIVVYWLESGNVWHESRACSSLARSSPDKIISGNEEDAKKAGKERACKKCSSNK